MNDTFDESYDMEIQSLISQLLLIQQKRLEKDPLYSDEGLTNSYIYLPQKGDLFEYITILTKNIKEVLSVLSEDDLNDV